MINHYQKENFRAQTYELNKSSIQELTKEFSRPRFACVMPLADLSFKTPCELYVGAPGKKSVKLSRTGLESARRLCGIPLGYMTKIEPETVRLNLNRRLGELCRSGVDAVQMISEHEDFRLIDGFLKASDKYIPDNKILELVYAMKRDKTLLRVTRTRGQTAFQVIYSDEILAIDRDDAIHPGFTVINPWVFSRHQIFLSYERIVCSNGMMRMEKENLRSFTMGKPPAKVLQEYRNFLLRMRDFGSEIVPFRRMAETPVDRDMELPAIRKFYKGVFPSVLEFKENTYWDLYNCLTAEARERKDWNRITLMEKAGELARLFEEEKIQEGLWRYFRVA